MSEEKDEYKFYYQKAKRLYKDGRYIECIDCLKKAFDINPSENLQIKINKLEGLIEEKEVDDIQFKPDENKLLIEDKYYVNKINFNKLFGYQQQGVTWLFKTFESKKGCILADDMGLGKTVQMIFYLRELFESEMIKTALIIMPKSLLINWEREIKVWAPSIGLVTFFGNDRERNLKRIERKGGIMLSTYGTIMHSWDELHIKWGVLALDEGHKIKNPSSKTFKTVNALKAETRVVMTGTAVQNNLKELWALFDFTHQGSLLGSYPTFNREYEKPITDGRKKDATQHEKLYGDQIALSLKKLIKPYFLRRTKEEVCKQKALDEPMQVGVPEMSRKNDLIVWLPMTEAQIDFYKKFLEVDEMKIRLLRTEKRSPLLELNVLKKICDHPRLLSPDQCAELGLPFASTIESLSIESLIAESGKMAFLICLVKHLTNNEHKCLIFSQSKRILTFIQRILITERIPFLRLDGDVLKALARQEIVDNFNTDPRFKVLLLTSQVGGIGLTLTGADRVIIYDLNWNPSIDAQAVDRVYRIGQVKNVVIYRLITCGTVEEKIYRRQIFKDSLNRQTTGNNEVDDNSYRYFTQNELFELFTLGDPHRSDTQIQLDEMHSKQRSNDPALATHIDWLQQQKSVFGISDHDLLFSQADDAIHVDEATKDMLIETIQQAESVLIREAKTKETVEEQNLREMLGKMAIVDKKPHSKVKEHVPKESMFIPSKSDMKRPMPNMFGARQPRLDAWIVGDKGKSNFVDLTMDNDDMDSYRRIDPFILRDTHGGGSQLAQHSGDRPSVSDVTVETDSGSEDNDDSSEIDQETFESKIDYRQKSIRDNHDGGNELAQHSGDRPPVSDVSVETDVSDSGSEANDDASEIDQETFESKSITKIPESQLEIDISTDGDLIDSDSEIDRESIKYESENSRDGLEKLPSNYSDSDELGLESNSDDNEESSTNDDAGNQSDESMSIRPPITTRMRITDSSDDEPVPYEPVTKSEQSLISNRSTEIHFPDGNCKSGSDDDSASHKNSQREDSIDYSILELSKATVESNVSEKHAEADISTSIDENSLDESAEILDETGSSAASEN